MPGIVRASTVSLVMPDSLSTSFQEIHQYYSRLNKYADGSASRLTLHDTPRKKFVLAKALRTHLESGETKAPYQTLRDFIATTRYGMEAFYFYNYREGVYDPSGVSTAGRYAVVFRGNWSEAVVIGRRSPLELTLEEVE